MSDPFAYMDNMIAARSHLLSAEEQLAGGTTISLETCEDLSKDSFAEYIQDNFAGFIQHIRVLKKEEQEMLLAYYLLRKKQDQLAAVFQSTQTGCSFRIRMAVKSLCVFLMWGGSPSVAIMRKILDKAKLEPGEIQLFGYTAGKHVPKDVPLSQVISEYAVCHNFQKIAELHHLHRPDIRRAMSRASKQLMEVIENADPPVIKDPQELALGAYIFSLIDKVNSAGEGKTKREKRKYAAVTYFQDSAYLGEFRHRTDEVDMDVLFTSRANLK